MVFRGIEDVNGDIVNLSNSSELQEGDRIVNIDGAEINEIQDLKDVIAKSDGSQMNMKVIGSVRRGKKYFSYTN